MDKQKKAAVTSLLRAYKDGRIGTGSLIKQLGIKLITPKISTGKPKAKGGAITGHGTTYKRPK